MAMHGNAGLRLSFPFKGGGTINLYTILFIVFFGIGYGAYYATADMPIPMVADCSDYGTYRSGKYSPGIMGTMFSLVDKLVSSLAQTLVALIFLACTGVNKLPNDATPYETKLLSQLELTGKDGAVTTICTDGTWQWSNDGPIRFADNKDGEIVDARMTPSYSGRAKITSAPVRFCSFSPNRECRKKAGKRVQPLNNYTCRFRPSSLKRADKSGLDGLQDGK